MCRMQCVKYFLCYYFLVFGILSVESISNYANDKPILKEEDRRAAEKPEHVPQPQSIEKISESKKRGIFLAAKGHSPTSLLQSAVAVGYNREGSFGGSKFDEGRDRRPIHDDHDGRPYYYPPPPSSSDNRGGYYPGPGRYPPSSSYPSDYGHTSPGVGVYDHLGPIEYDYPPTGGHGHDSGVGYHHGGGGGGFKNPLALKGLLLPLAGIALLGAAAALTTNPVLLQLGVINGRGRRRRGLLENANRNVYPINHIVKPDGSSRK